MDDPPEIDVAAEGTRQRYVSEHLGMILFWISFGTLILTGILYYVGINMEPGGVGDMRGLAHLFVVSIAGALGLAISAGIALVASFYERAAGTLFVLELVLLGICLLPVLVLFL